MSADSASPAHSSRLLRALRVERSEVRPAFLLTLFLLLGMAAVICLKAVSDAIFLSEFDATRLPYVDLAITVLVGLLVNYYLRWSGRLPLGSLVATTQLCLAASIVALWLLLTAGAPWSAILLYLWVGVFAILIPSQVWSLAAATFTTRQAKRLFALIGSGGILGAAIGGNFTGVMGPYIGAVGILPVAAALLAAGAWIARTLTAGGPIQARSPGQEDHSNAPIVDSARLVSGNRYLLLIALAVIASTIVGTLVKYQFKAQTQAYFDADLDGIASFAGYFYGYISVVSLLFHATLSNRLLRTAGLSLTLFVLPVALFSGVIGLLLSSSIFAAVWARGADQGFRHSVDRSSSELLWVPVDSGIRNRVKSFMDVVVSRAADGVASLVLLALLYFEHTTTQQISWVSLAFLGFWIIVLWILRSEYLETLRTAIERPDISAEQLLRHLAASGPSSDLAARLASSDPHDVEIAVGIAQFSGMGAAQAQLAALLVHPSPAVRRKAMATVASLEADGCEHNVVAFLRLEPDFDTRQQAFDYFDKQDSSAARSAEEELLEQEDSELAAMAAARLLTKGNPPQHAAAVFHQVVSQKSAGNAAMQVVAAKLLGMAPADSDRSALLTQLLASPEPAVAEAAIRSIGRLAGDEDLPTLMRLLAQPAYGAATRQAVTAYGPRAIAPLAAILRDDSASPYLQRQAAKALGTIGGRASVQCLFAYLRRTHEGARADALRALKRIRDRDSDQEFHPEIVDLLLVSALRRFYQTAAYAESIRAGGQGVAARFLAQALRERKDRWLDEAFVLLEFVFPQREIRDARYRIRSAQPALRSNALEFLDSRLLGMKIRPMLLPAVEEVEPQRVLRTAKKLFDVDSAPYASVLRSLLEAPDAWLQACACHTAAESEQRDCKPRIVQLTHHPDPLLRETAIAASARL
ncbi:MAG: Npt1/Npt2 family nucleotide transporter [Acidobacteria bacterium]|nr:Npt1/Npt2 family nucleotide transporter [Acidobacteriota bacterium]